MNETIQKCETILIVNVIGNGFGGQETHVISLFKELNRSGTKALLLVLAKSSLHNCLIARGIPCYAVPYFNIPGYYTFMSFLLSGILLFLCKRHHIRVIHCNNRFEITSAKRISSLLGVQVLLNYHVTSRFDVRQLSATSAFISPSKEIAQFIAQKAREHHLRLKSIQALPPLFDATPFLTFRSNQPSLKWFFDNFGVTIKPIPLMCSIGNMVPDLEHKNYPLLFRAMAYLIHEEAVFVQVVLVGDGPAKPFLEGLSKDLSIDEYVHFLGYSNENVPGILFHSDFFVLASNKEAFGIVYLEAGLMRKPVIGARKTGAEHIIIHETSGLLFENGDAQSLAAAIRRLSTNPSERVAFGGKGYTHITQNFLPSVVVERYQELYDSLSN